MNAKEELKSHVQAHKKTILCASIRYSPSYNDSENQQIILRKGYTDSDLRTFLSKLDFDYSDGYGSQYIYGTIWYTDRTWSTRGEYDGSEWWVLNQRPPVPKECK